MYKSGFSNLAVGFFLIMINIRIQGVDIFPDIVGYLFLGSGINNLISSSGFFSKASKYNIFMIIFSVFSIYQAPAPAGGINMGTFGAMGIFGIILAIISFILNLLLVYNIFMGIKDMAEQLEKYDLANESEQRWSQYKTWQIAFLFAFILIFIPMVAILYFVIFFIVTIILTINILGFLKRCGESLNASE